MTVARARIRVGARVGGPHMGDDGPMREAAETTGPATPTWTAATVARRLGVAPATLRSWSVRYGIGPPDHHPGRHRRYTSTDIAELDTMHRLSRDGMPLATAAAVARHRHRPSAHPGAEAGRDELATLLGAVRRLDSDTAVEVLGRSLAHRGVVDTWAELCRPALAGTDPAGAPEPGHRPSTSCVDAECVLVWAVTTSLRRLPPPAPAPPDAARVLLACAEGEQHALGTDVLLAALDESRVPARTLGPSVPSPALVHAVEQARPAALFVWAQTADTARPVAVDGLRARVGSLFAAGPGWSIRDLPAGVRVVRDLPGAVRCARAAVRPRDDGR